MVPESAQSFVDVAPRLLELHLTPLLRSEVENAVTLHRHADSSEQTQKRLEQVRQDLTKHWNKLFGSPFHLADYEISLAAFAKTLGGLVLNEYTLEHPAVEDLELPAYVWIYGSAQKRSQAVKVSGMTTESELQNQVNLNMKFWLSEFMLDREHVELRFRTACEDKNLARTLLKQEKREALDELMAKDEQVLKNLASYHEPCQLALHVVAVKMDQDFRPEWMQNKAATLAHSQDAARIYAASCPGAKLEDGIAGLQGRDARWDSLSIFGKLKVLGKAWLEAGR